MEQRCAPLSQSSNKHEAQTPAEVQRVTLSLFASGGVIHSPFLSQCSSIGLLEQLVKSQQDFAPEL